MTNLELKNARYEGGVLSFDTRDKDVRAFVYKFKPGVYTITPEKKKRSLNANAYAWALIGKIADAVREDKELVYLDMLKHYGQSVILSIESRIDVSGFFKYYEEAGERFSNGKQYTDYKVYKGSSEYDTAEMSVLIDGIVREAKDLDIETLPPEELERLKQKWR